MSDIILSASRAKFRNRLNIEWDTAIVGDGSGIVNDPFWIGSGRVYVRFLTDNGYSTPTLVRGPSRQLATALTDGLNIKIKYDNQEPYIDDVDVHAAVISNIYPVQNPPTSIGAGSGSTQDQLSTLRCSQDLNQPSLFVNISSWVPIVNNIAYNFPGDSVDLSSFVPSTGLHNLVVIFVKSDYSTTEAFASTPISLVDPLTVEIDLNEVLGLASAGSTPAWSYDIHGDMTQVLDTDTFLDNRQLVNNAASSATGDVSGPASATDNAVARFDGATGKLIQNSGVLIDDSNNITIPGIETTQSGKVRKTRVVTAAGAVTVTTADDIVVVDKSSGASTTVNLPATPTTGQTFWIHDGKGDAATNHITITPAAGNINGASTLVLSIAYATAICTYNGTQWDATIAETGSTGTGDFVGPASATNNDLVAFDGTTGKLGKDSGLLTADVAKAVAILADKFLLQTADATNLPNAQAMGALATGLVKNTNTTGVQSIATAGTDYTSPAGTENLSNKTITASSLIATALSLLIGGFKAIFTQANTADRTYTLPDATTTLVGTDTVQTLTNKSIAASEINSGQLATAQGGTGVDLSASGSATAFLAEDASHVVSARNIADADLPTALAGHTITGGSINNTPIGATTANTAIFSAQSLLIGGFKAIFTHANSADRTYTFPNKNGTVAMISDIPSVPLTTKGDLLGFDTADARVPIGTNNQVLTADSSQSLGLKWTLVSLVNSVTGLLGLANGGTHADLSATGGTNQFVKQSSVGADLTVGTIASADIATALLTPGPIGTTTPNTGYFTTFKIKVGGFFATITHAFTADRTVTLPGDANVTLVGLDTTQTLTNKTLTTPTIGDFSNANHNHTNSAGGGQLTDAALSAAVSASKGGTGLTTLTSNNLLVGNGTGTVTFIAPGSKGGILSSTGTVFSTFAAGTNGQGVVYDSTQTNGLRARNILNPRNLIINGAMQWWQAVALSPTTAVTVGNDVYTGADDWYVLASIASLTVARTTAGGAVASPTLYALNITATSNNPKCGIAQIVEQADSLTMRSRAVTAQCRVNPVTSQAIRIALLEWTGTADSVTSDVVNNWASTNYTTGNFFKSTNFTLVATANVTPTANNATDLSCTGTVSSSCNNLILFVFTEGSLANGDTLWIGECGIFEGSDLITWVDPDPASELIRSQRWIQVFASASGVRTHLPIMGHANTTTNMTMMYLPPVTFKSLPTLTATGSDWDVLINNTNVALTGISLTAASPFNTIQIDGTSSGMTQGVHGILQGDSGGDRYLNMNCYL